jgi:hypothetical protein
VEGEERIEVIKGEELVEFVKEGEKEQEGKQYGSPLALIRGHSTLGKI